MAVIEKTFAIDEGVVEKIDTMFDFDEQTKYVNQLFSSLIEKRNRELIEQTIWQNYHNKPDLNSKTSTELLREIRDANYNVL